MDDLLGIDKQKLKDNAPLLLGALGALAGYWFTRGGRSVLPLTNMHVPRLVRAASAAAALGYAGYFAGDKVKSA
jgi:hypothetical protein